MKEWVEKGPAWAFGVLEILGLEREYRTIEQNCYQKAPQ